MTTEVDVSEIVLDRVAERTFRFIVNLARMPRLHAAMRTRGFTAAVEAQGWSLIDRVTGRGGAPRPDDHDSSETVETAIARIDAWVSVNVPIVKAALRYSFAAQHTFLFGDGLGVAHGADAVRVAVTLAARLDALRSSTERSATRNDDAAALALLAERGVTEPELRRLTTRIDLVRNAHERADMGVGNVRSVLSVPPPSLDDPRRALYVWFSEWSEIARVLTPRRMDRIRLGLAARRRPGDANASERGSNDDNDDDNDDDSDNVRSAEGNDEGDDEANVANASSDDGETTADSVAAKPKPRAARTKPAATARTKATPARARTAAPSVAPPSQ